MLHLIRKIAGLTLIAAALTVLIVAHFLPTCELDANVSIASPLGGNIDAGLSGKLYLYGFDVNAGVEGGGGLLGNVTVDNERFFVQGPPPELAERVGIIMNSYKEKTYPITAEIYDVDNDTTNHVKIDVTTHIDRVPLWVESIDQTVTVTVEINESVGLKQVEITKVWIEIWTDYNKDDDKEWYNEKEEVWSKTVSDVLTSDDDTVTYTHDMKYGSDEKRIGIVSRIDCIFTDVNNTTEDDPLEPFKSDSHPNPNNVYGATNYQAFKVLLMVLAFPLFIIAGLLAIIAVVKVLREKKGAVKLLIISAVMIGSALFFYRWGVNTILDMLEIAPSLDMLAEKYFHWNWAVNLPLISAGLMAASVPFAFRWGKKKSEDGKTEEEAKENDEGEGGEGDERESVDEGMAVVAVEGEEEEEKVSRES